MNIRYLILSAFILMGCSSSDDSTTSGTATPTNCGAAETRVDGVCTPDPIIKYQACDDTIAGAASFQTDEYYNSGYDKATGTVTEDSKTPLALICASAAYARIPANMQGGAGQTVAVMDDGFNTSHEQFENLDGVSIAFDAVFDASAGPTGTLYNSHADITNKDKGNCYYTILTIPCNETHGSHVSGTIAARKNDTQMHGVAYEAQLIGIVRVGVALTTAQNIAAIQAGSGSDIVAMNNSWGSPIDACTQYQGKNYYYKAVPSSRILWADDCSTPTNFRLADAVINAWKEAVDSGTIIVFANGNNGLNSETGMVNLFTDKDLTTGYAQIAAIDLFGGVSNANIPSLRGSYPTLYDDALATGRWLTVVAVDKNAKIASFSNGCGVAMHFCLAAPGVGIYSAKSENILYYNYATQQGTSMAAPHVSGALAVLQAAFPAMTPDNLVKLVLETSTYIPLDNKNPDGTDFLTEEVDNRTVVTKTDGTTRHINPVYGYGLLNLNAATTPSVSMSYLSVGNNESIGALWKDTHLTLSSHFGGGLDNVKLGIGDHYGRHFTTTANKTTTAPLVLTIDDYMSNLLAETVQSERLNPQARANYSNTGENNWMNLQYTSGKATSKIAFQESYKINPLKSIKHDMGAASILRANHIRPASTNIGMMDVDYQLSNALSLSSYAARGEYDTGYKFDELGTDFDVNYKKSHLNIGIGHLREHEQFLGTNTSGGYALRKPSVSQFTDVTYGHDVGAKFNLYANYINYETDVDMLHHQFATIDNLQADQYQIGFKGKGLISDDDGLNVALITKLGVTDGSLNQNTVLGYTTDGNFRNVSQSYDLAVTERHQQFEITYQGKLYQNADKVSALKDNRFFTTLRVDQNLNHVQGASQTEIVSGINARF